MSLNLFSSQIYFFPSMYQIAFGARIFEIFPIILVKVFSK